MNLSCSDLPPLLAARPLGVLDASEETSVEKHLSGCPECRKLEGEIAASLASAKPATLEPPASVWAGVAARIAEDRSGKALEPRTPALPPPPEAGAIFGQGPSAPPRLAPRIALACTFCHSEVLRREAVFCGSCLAPHHESCFLQHGRCSAPGCTETRTVRPRDTVVRPARPQPSVLRGPLVALLLASGVAALTLVAVGLEDRRQEAAAVRPTPSAPSASSEPPAPEVSPSPWRTPAPFAIEPERAAWTQATSWTGPDELSREIRMARVALTEGRLSDVEDHLLRAGSRGFNVVHEVWGNTWPELEPLRRRRGFFRRAAEVAPVIPHDEPTRDPFQVPAKEGAK